MNGNNLKPTYASEKPATGRGDWRTQLRSDLRQRIVNKMFDRMMRHLRSSGEDELNELRKTVETFEEKTYNATSNQFDYVRRISMKLLQKETQSQNIVQNSGQCSNNLQNPGSQSMQSEQVHVEGLSHQNIPNDMKGKSNIYDLPGKDGPDDFFPKQWPPLPALYISEQMPTIWSTSVDFADLTMGQQNNLSNMHQQQQQQQQNSWVLSNISGLQQQQQQLVGTQLGNSSMQTNQQSLHMLSQPKVALQQTQQTAPNLLPTQGQTSQQPQQEQQLMSQMQSQPTQLQQQLGLQQQPNQVQQNMQQTLQASGQTSSSLLQLYQSQRAVLETSTTSLDSTAQTGHSNGGDWQEEVYQKAMKETYFPELNMMHKKISAKLLQVEQDSLPQQPKSARLEKMKLFKTMLERILAFLTISKAAIVPAFKDKLSSYEEQIRKFIIANRPMKLVSALQQGQLLPTHMHSMQQPQPESLHRVDEQQSPAKIKTNELSYWHEIDINSGVQGNLPSNQLPGYEEARSEYHAPDTAGIGVPPTMSIPPLLPGFKEVNDTSGNALTTDFGKPDITEQPHDLKVNMAKPKSLSATVVTMVDEAVSAVGEDLAAMKKQGLHARNFFTQTGMSGAEKMRCYLSALVILALLIFFIFNLNHQY
ncbi:hypothetical protein E1A91_A05G129200v1 [Gossypium mustelinum]|uniref:Mediator complex subunit 15 KIX domain-containing protein n=1 Tax=Gossypium mustelinum TaxID=34275 RepID=A0A5D2Z775_GOSMU|nr:hypothetical protein E1A91_A05G129200v1 [Gossypium mustelinum]